MEITIPPESADMLDTLNMNAGAIQAVATAFLVIITAWYVHLTRQLATSAKSQGELLRQQGFESTFFQLLRFHADIVESLETQHGSSLTKGRPAFESIRDTLVTTLASAQSNPTNQHDTLTLIDDIYKKVCQAPHSDFGYYFRNLYQLFKFIDQSGVADPQRYASLLRAQLSTAELTLLFYNCLSSIGREKFKPLVERYATFEDLRVTHPIVESHKQFYASSAYGR